MTDQGPQNDQTPAPTPPSLPPKSRRDPVVAVLMVIGGVILLLPGVCSLFFMSAMGSGDAGVLGLLWLICFAISAGGLAMIVKAFR